MNDDVQCFHTNLGNVGGNFLTGDIVVCGKINEDLLVYKLREGNQMLVKYLNLKGIFASNKGSTKQVKVEML